LISGIEPLLPEGSETLEPGIDLRRRHRDRPLADAELLRDHHHHVAGRVPARGEQLADASASRVAQDVEGAHR
jgi:hypothetical protein